MDLAVAHGLDEPGAVGQVFAHLGAFVLGLVDDVRDVARGLPAFLVGDVNVLDERVEIQQGL